MSKGDAVSLIGKVELSGDFFTHDPGKTLRANVRDMMDAIAEWAEAEAKAGIASATKGEVYQHVRGYTTGTRGGGRWGTWAAVNVITDGMPRPDAIRTQAKLRGRHDTTAGHGTTVGIEPRLHAFRRVKQGVYRSRPIIQANLAKHL